MKAAAIFTVGASVGGTPDAIAEVLKREDSLDVYLVYGEQGYPGTADPRRFADQIRQQVTDQRVSWPDSRAVAPFDFPDTYGQIRDVISDVGRAEYDRVYVGITGGTNPMAASLFQAAMAYLRTEVTPLYVQALGSSWQSNFVASDIRDRVNAEEVLGLARTGQIRVAAILAERLPDAEMKWKFVRRSLSALASWDDFDYRQAAGTLQQFATKTSLFGCDPLLHSLAETVQRLAAQSSAMASLPVQICDLEHFAATASGLGWGGQVRNTGSLLVADVLSNAQRRMVEGRYTDSVLRSYRAAECATQMRLLAIGVHPSKCEAWPEAYARFRPLLETLGETVSRGLAFWAGLKFLDAAGEIAFADVERPQRDLAAVRNQSYLEHGYNRIQLNGARRAFENAMAICRVLLDSGIELGWREFEMRF